MSYYCSSIESIWDQKNVSHSLATPEPAISGQESAFDFKRREAWGRAAGTLSPNVADLTNNHPGVDKI